MGYFCIGLLALLCGTARAEEYIVGADLSWLKQAENTGVVFKDGGRPKPALQIFREHGYNWVRLRLFHTPTELPNDFVYTAAAAREARNLGFRILLDLHYSDGWADPHKQNPPKAWEGLTHEALVKAVFEYTRQTLIKFREAGVQPDMVQIGNEINHGMLWPDGRLSESWPNFADLLRAGVRGVEAAGGRPRIMIHVALGGDPQRTRAFFDKLDAFGVRYDVIGQSYYPWWHGTLEDLRKNLASMAAAYGKDIVVVETGYYWKTPARRKGDKNIVEFPETPGGQKSYLEALWRVIRENPKARGFFWWEPATVDRLLDRGFFDAGRNALPVLTVFDPQPR